MESGGRTPFTGNPHRRPSQVPFEPFLSYGKLYLNNFNEQISTATPKMKKKLSSNIKSKVDLKLTQIMVSGFKVMPSDLLLQGVTARRLGREPDAANGHGREAELQHRIGVPGGETPGEANYKTL